MNTAKIRAAQMPTMGECRLQLVAHSQPIEISVGSEKLYAEALGFPQSAWVLLCAYVNDCCSMEVSMTPEDARELADRLNAMAQSCRSEVPA